MSNSIFAPSVPINTSSVCHHQQQQCRGTVSGASSPASSFGGYSPPQQKQRQLGDVPYLSPSSLGGKATTLSQHQRVLHTVPWPSGIVGCSPTPSTSSLASVPPLPPPPSSSRQSLNLHGIPARMATGFGAPTLLCFSPRAPAEAHPLLPGAPAAASLLARTSSASDILSPLSVPGEGCPTAPTGGQPTGGQPTGGQPTDGQLTGGQQAEYGDVISQRADLRPPGSSAFLPPAGGCSSPTASSASKGKIIPLR